MMSNDNLNHAFRFRERILMAEEEYTSKEGQAEEIASAIRSTKSQKLVVRVA